MEKFKKKAAVVPVAASPQARFKKKIVPEERFKREYSRDVVFPDEVKTYIWVFTEYKHPDKILVPYNRLQEEKFVMDGRDRVSMRLEGVTWEVDMEVRMLAYMAFQKHLTARRNELT